MRRAFPLVMLLLIALLAASSVSSQTPQATPEGIPLEGIEYIAVRQYEPDPFSPARSEDTGPLTVTIRIYAFDSQENADAGWESAIESTAIESDVSVETHDIAFSEDEVEGMGDRAWVTTLSAEVSEGESGYFRLLYVQDGTMLYTLSTIADSGESTVITDDLARVMVEREPGDGEPEFSGDGTSTGGIWEILPPSDNEVLDGLIPFADFAQVPVD